MHFIATNLWIDRECNCLYFVCYDGIRGLYNFHCFITKLYLNFAPYVFSVYFMNNLPITVQRYKHYDFNNLHTSQNYYTKFTSS